MSRSLGWRVSFPFILLLAILIGLGAMLPESERPTLIAIGAAACLLALILAAWIARYVMQPLRTAARSASHAAAKLSQVESALQAERDKFDAVLREMSDSVVIVDDTGRIQALNPAAEQVFSITLGEVRGISLAKAIRYFQVAEMWRACRESGKLHSSLIEISAEKLYLQAAAAPLPGEPLGGVLLLFQNLTRQRFLETVRRDFVSNISHELRTPLASLKALTETLQAGALEDPPAARRFLELIETEVDALSHIVGELLELSRIESGRVPLHLRPTPPLEIIHPAVDRLRLQAERARLQIVIECPRDLPPLQADLPRLQQVMVNLIHNAIKFTPPPGTITITASKMEASESRAAGILFRVRDTGVGISVDDLPRIFERFYKADRARSSGGTGLGLAIARHTVEAHRGQIWAESLESAGSVFSFIIPLAE
jgi:two-component system phosphate regulon sensor histidine kinase PhoR